MTDKPKLVILDGQIFVEKTPNLFESPKDYLTNWQSENNHPNGTQVRLIEDYQPFKSVNWSSECEQLERELTTARAEIAEWRILNGWGGTPEIINDFIKGQQTRIHHAQDLETELTFVTEHRDRLAEALNDKIKP